MKLAHRTLTFAVLLTAVMMAVNEFPELFTLTDNTANDYVSARSQSEAPPQTVVKERAGQLLAAAVAFCLPIRLHVAAASNFLVSSTAKSPRSLLLLLVTQRT
jgi:hypothetical protein